MRKITKRTAAIAATAALVIGGAGAAAWAAGWFGGSGTVTATTSAIHNLTASATLGSNLYPGKTVQTTVTVPNENDYPVTITGIDTVTLTQAGGSGCNLTNSDISAALPSLPKNIASKGELKVIVPITMGMNADPKCAASTLTIGFNLLGQVAPDNTATSAI